MALREERGGKSYQEISEKVWLSGCHSVNSRHIRKNIFNKHIPQTHLHPKDKRHSFEDNNVPLWPETKDDLKDE